MRFLILALSVMGILVSADAARADRRVAFVVGNGTYKTVTPLANPPIDAKSMAGVLRNAGFDVVEGINLTRDKMTERLLEFGKKTQGADVAVFFMPATASTLTASTTCCRSMPTSNPKWMSSSVTRSTSISRSTRP
jgi:Caspase domain